MLVVDSTPEQSKMPFSSRRRRNLSTSVQNQVEAQGPAWLCFAEDHSWFQGNIHTDDESNYSLYGKRVSQNTNYEEEEKEGSVDTEEDELRQQLDQLILTNNKQDSLGSCGESSEEEVSIAEQNNNDLIGLKRTTCSSSTSSVSSTTEEYYNVTLTDHFSGLRYQLPKIFFNFNKEDGPNKSNLFICADGHVSFEVENVFKGQRAELMIQRHFGSPSLLGKKCLVYHGPINILFNEVIDHGRSWCL